jgi:molecular chaperone GrpE
MADKNQENTVKVVDRRRWANPDRAAGDTGAASNSLKPTYVEHLEQQLAEKDKQAQEYIAKYRQASAEFDEARLRLRREISKDIERVRREVISEMLEVLDNLDRAIEAADKSGSSDSVLLQGVDLVRRQFLAKLEGLGVRRIDAISQRFDPSLHEAVTTVPAVSADQDGQIVGVIRHGYRIGDEVLRPAAVAVASVDTRSAGLQPGVR